MAFFEKVKTQWSKITWLNKNEIGKQVVAVVVATFVSAVIISGLDTVGKLIVNAIINFRF